MAGDEFKTVAELVRQVTLDEAGRLAEAICTSLIEDAEVAAAEE